MYKIVFPIPIRAVGNTSVFLPQGLARDIVSQLKYEPQVKLICPAVRAGSDPKDYVELRAADHPGLSWRVLPWEGGRKGFWLGYRALQKILVEEASDCDVWHATCSIALWDITSLAYVAGRRHAPRLKVLGLDSDPAAMLEKSNSRYSRWLSGHLAGRYARWAGEVDATVMVGEGVVRRFGASAKRYIPTNAVWLNADELADPDAMPAKYADSDPIRMILATRLLPWKGVDDTLQALLRLQERLPDWRLDIVGEGPELAALQKLAAPLGNRVRFLAPVPYGREFFGLLQQYHLALAPTRAVEEARIVYDAAASGCVLVNSRTSTLEAALKAVPIRYSFEPGEIASLESALLAAVADRVRWGEAAQAGIASMQGRTIDEMHQVRSQALAPLRVR